MSSVTAAPARRSEAYLGNAMPIYLDNQSSTRLDPRVLEAMLPYFTEQYGNPHSASHAYGRMAAEAIEQARSEIAALIHAIRASSPSPRVPPRRTTWRSKVPPISPDFIRRADNPVIRS